jgi:hypothetical protein
MARQPALTLANATRHLKMAHLFAYWLAETS